MINDTVIDEVETNSAMEAERIKKEQQMKERELELKQEQEAEINKKLQTCRYCEEAQATHECQNCKEIFCQKCCNALHSKGAFKTHTINAFEAQQRNLKAYVYCADHPDEKLSLYCVTDKELCCSACALVCFFTTKLLLLLVFCCAEEDVSC